MILKLLKLRRFNIYDQLKLEEAIMRVDSRPNVAYFLLNEGTPKKCVVMGSGGNAEEVLHMDHIRQDKFPVVRRFTGGGTVVVSPKTAFVSILGSNQLLTRCTFPIEEAEDHLNLSEEELMAHEKEVEYSAVKNVAADFDVTEKLKKKIQKGKVFLPYPKDIMLWSEHFYGPIFPPKVQFSLRENDYVFGDVKFGGNAQYVTGGVHKRFCHHTSFLWDFEKEDMYRYLSLPKKRPAYRSDRSHSSFLVRMKDALQGEYDEDSPKWFLDRVEERLRYLCEKGEWSHEVEKLETIYEDDDLFKEIQELQKQQHLSRTFYSYNAETGDDEYANKRPV
jgi:lipoate-protein ligase A